MESASNPARPRSVKTREATETQRVEMHTLYHRGKWTLERIGKELGFHATTVGRIVKVPLVSPRKTRNRGRHKILNADIVNNMIELGTKDAHHRGLSFASLGSLAGINASERVIREALQGMGYDRRIAVFETGSNKGPKKDKGKGKQTEGIVEAERDVEAAEGFLEGMTENSDERQQPAEEAEGEGVMERIGENGT
ncbi:hypothetical protein L211DRAFT_870417 [Terfezia boudieri ATCC MYA-4762]|uniref:Transposase IS30-like HTH domain-containing protein n=1 Tax=Terfezia boudieri ATCC MYA-4762 TaxID=1051890 RepID=A0A3N4LD88_9PEZI|nr:hypothetical protein L211DRAFT_870417 [Terfezia boudieri ATCC MYA-4762]